MNARKSNTHVLTALGILLIAVVVAAATIKSAYANPNSCPPGQEKAHGCKWVQHIVTFKCMWLPAEAVAHPWKEIPEGTCPHPIVNTPVTTAVVILNSPTPPATGTPWHDPSATPKASSTATQPGPRSSATACTSIPGQVLTPVSSGTPCPWCEYEATQAAAAATQAYNSGRSASALETMAAKP